MPIHTCRPLRGIFYTPYLSSSAATFDSTDATYDFGHNTLQRRCAMIWMVCELEVADTHNHLSCLDFTGFIVMDRYLLPFNGYLHVQAARLFGGSIHARNDLLRAKHIA